MLMRMERTVNRRTVSRRRRRRTVIAITNRQLVYVRVVHHCM